MFPAGTAVFYRDIKTFIGHAISTAGVVRKEKK
jgi:hypothetical protein